MPKRIFHERCIPEAYKNTLIFYCFSAPESVVSPPNKANHSKKSDPLNELNTLKELVASQHTAFPEITDEMLARAYSPVGNFEKEAVSRAHFDATMEAFNRKIDIMNENRLSKTNQCATILTDLSTK